MLNLSKLEARLPAHSLRKLPDPVQRIAQEDDRLYALLPFISDLI